MNRRKQPLGDCKIFKCWQKARYRSGLCGACYQSIRIRQFQTPTELMAWAERVERFRSRILLLTGQMRLRRVK